MADLTTETVQKITRLQEANDELKEALEPLYTLIGRNYYEKPEGYEKEIEEAAERLDSMKKQIRENYLETLALRGIRLCPNCDGEVEQEAVFCGECGTRMEPVEEADENSVICGRCGAKNKKTKKFCIICGQRLDAISMELRDGAAWQYENMKINGLGGPEPSGSPMPAGTARIGEAGAEGTVKKTSWVTTGPDKGQGGDNEGVFTGSGEAAPAKEQGPCCPNCGTSLPWDAIFCSECGSRVALAAAGGESPSCPFCNAKLPFDMVYCPECGRQVLP